VSLLLVSGEEIAIMTTLLSQAFDTASKLPEALQEQIASQLLEDIDAELKWEQAFANSQDQLAKLADKALEDFKAGRVKKMGFDEAWPGHVVKLVKEVHQ
jgi:hypothetical protein